MRRTQSMKSHAMVSFEASAATAFMDARPGLCAAFSVWPDTVKYCTRLRRIVR